MGDYIFRTAALFGLQHLSALATTGRAPDDVLENVAVSACYGLALAAFQYRFRWVWPLILVHAGADLTTILAADPLPDAVIGGTLVAFVGLAFVILRSSAGTGRPGPSTVPEGHGPRHDGGHTAGVV